MTNQYEAHMTFDAVDEVNVRDFESGAFGTWRFSKISGDPQLGAGVRCYLTSHADDPATLINQMEILRDSLRARGVETRRMKVEHVVYDTREEQ